MPDIEINVQDYQNVFSASVGSSPLIQVSVDHSFNTVSVDVVTQNPTVNVDIIGTGPQGPKGDTGDTGATGADGADGVSPEVTIASITGGHSVTITDADNPGGQTFNVMDGTDGQNGADGAAAGFGTPTASVDANVGTPAVTVTASGPDTAKVFDFAFSNLKGDKGDTGSTGSTGPAGPGVPSGGTTGQMLQKKSVTDYDTEWVTYTDADTKVEQTYTTTSGYTYWRPVVVGDSAVSTESAVFTTSTAAVRTFTNIRFQPSTGTLKATTFKGSLTGTASGNLTSSSTLNPANLSGVSTGTTQFLREDGTWATPAYPSVPGAYTSTPSVLGTASAGVSNDYSRGDHVHEMPSASDVGALADDTKYALSASVGGSASMSEAIPWGKVDGTSTATKFTATIPGITKLVDGTSFWLKNGVITSASGFTVNINNLGAKKCYNSMTAATQDTTIFNINYTMMFVYDSSLDSGAGGYYIYRGYNSDNNTIGYQLRTNSYILKTADKFRYYKVLFTSADGTKWVPAASATDNSATSAKTVNQRPINPFGEIVYCGNSTSYAADADVSATAIWQEYTFSLGYSFNRTGAALTLTSKAPVYVKAAPQADGSAIIDSTTPYVQALPNSADGKIYIFLGVAYSATNIELTMRHPVYFHDGTGIREWTGKVPFSGDYTDLSNKPTIPSTAADVGAIALPASPTSGDFLVYNGSSWAAMSLSVWQGGSY